MSKNIVTHRLISVVWSASSRWYTREIEVFRSLIILLPPLDLHTVKKTAKIVWLMIDRFKVIAILKSKLRIGNGCQKRPNFVAIFGHTSE